MSTYPPPIPQEDARVLHARLRAGDPVASADLHLAYVEYLTKRLTERNSRVDEDMLHDAAWSAVDALIRNPGSYDPERSDLAPYLYMSARGDLANLMEKETRRRSRLVNLDAAQSVPDLQGFLGDYAADPAEIVELRETVRERLEAERVLMAGALESLTPQERAVFKLMREGEFHTAAFAGVLGILDRPLSEQRTTVKRIKDRINKRIIRGASHV